MAEMNIGFGKKTLRISALSENIIRVRVSKDFSETLFERYGIYRKADENCGQTTENGIRAGKLSAEYTNGEITFTTDKFSRTMRLFDCDNDGIADYFNAKLNNFQIPHLQIIGDGGENVSKPTEFQHESKYMTFPAGDEKYYGLGESNTDRIVLNGKTYMERVEYVKCEIPVPFLMTKAGFGILCNSTFWHGVDVCARKENEICWYLPDGDLDFTVFSGDNLPEILERFTYVTGRPALLPKWAYGLTFVEQYNADQFEVMHDAEKFRALGLPCDMFSLEPGWMTKNYDFSVNKKWNTQKFYICDWARGEKPRDNFFTAALQRYGYRLQLWLCCNHDFTANEERLAGNEVAPEIPAWFDHLKQFCNDGAASYKVDPCHVVDSYDETRMYANGKSEPEMHNLMQTLCVKEMYRGAAEHRKTRPMHHFCGGYTGAGAYSAFTTGDSGGKLKTLVWILNTGLSGISNITCDMDIFTKNTIHYCFFTAWCQLNSWSGFCHPWWAGDEMQEYFTFYDKLRYSLMPYIYSSAIQANKTGIPVCRAMPLMFDDKECENAICEYMFGENLLVGAFSDKIYLPAGCKWIDCWTKKVYEGGQEITPEIPENRGGPLFVRGGGIIVREEPKTYTDCVDADKLTVEVYPEGESSYTLYEDDGVTINGETSETVLTCVEAEKEITFTVSERKGSFNGMKKGRVYKVKMFTGEKPAEILVNEKKIQFTSEDGFAIFNTAEGIKNVITK